MEGGRQREINNEKISFKLMERGHIAIVREILKKRDRETERQRDSVCVCVCVCVCVSSL